jgi:hypothetical protein
MGPGGDGVVVSRVITLLASSTHRPSAGRTMYLQTVQSPTAEGLDMHVICAHLPVVVCNLHAVR